MKILLVVVLSIFPLFSTHGDEETIRSEIDSKVETIEKRSKKSRQSFSIKKRHYTEKWTYSTLGGTLEYLATSYFRRHAKYSETYYLQRGQLVYATEREDRYSGNDENSQWEIAWTAHYYVEEGKLAWSWTSGHGKSEADDWEPDPVGAFRSRLKTLKKKLKPHAAITDKVDRKE